MIKQVHKYSLYEILTGNITEQTDDLPTQVEDGVLTRVKTFLMNKDNLLGLSNPSKQARQLL